MLDDRVILDLLLSPADSTKQVLNQSQETSHIGRDHLKPGRQDLTHGLEALCAHLRVLTLRLHVLAFIPSQFILLLYRF